jgi:hypothetical protein
MIVLLVGCQTRYIPMETVREDSVYSTLYHRDSIFERDSIFVAVKADTVYFTKTQYRYRDRIVRDTLRVLRVDTLSRVVEVEKNLTRMERIKMSLGEVFLWLLMAAAVVVALWFGRKLKGL